MKSIVLYSMKNKNRRIDNISELNISFQLYDNRKTDKTSYF